jgi:hypothetical protein
MTARLDGSGHTFNHKPVARLLMRLGLEEVGSKPRLNQGGSVGQIRPGALHGRRIRGSKQAWDIGTMHLRFRRRLCFYMQRPKLIQVGATTRKTTHEIWSN